MKVLPLKWVLIICFSIIFIGSIYYFISKNQQVDYQVLKIDEAPAIIYEKYEQQKSERGFSVNPYNNSKYVLITMGTAPTAGYRIDVKSVQKQDENWIIKTKFISPDPEDIVAMVITFPAIVVKLPKEAINIQVLADNKPLSQFK